MARFADNVPFDDPAVVRFLAVHDEQTPAEQREMIRSTYRAVIAFDRTGDVDQLVRFAKAVVTSTRLRSRPEFIESLRRAPAQARSRDDALDVDEVAKLLME